MRTDAHHRHDPTAGRAAGRAPAPGDDDALPPPGPVVPPPPPHVLLDRIRAGWAARLAADPAQDLTAALEVLDRLEREGPGFTAGPAPRRLRTRGDAALLRADLYGCLGAGEPRRAARLARKDAAATCAGEAVHGAMWSAALVAAAFTARDADEAVAVALRHVPVGSPTGDAVCDVLVDRVRAGAGAPPRPGARHPETHHPGANPEVAVPSGEGSAPATAARVATCLLWGGAPVGQDAPLVGFVRGILCGTRELTDCQEIPEAEALARRTYLVALAAGT